MVDKLFLQVLNLSFTGSVVIGFVLVSRVLLRKAPKIFSYALWLVVLFRLLCPFSMETIFSLLPTKPNPIVYDIEHMVAPQIDTGIDSINHTVNSILQPVRPMNSINPLQIWIFIGSRIWVLGMLVLFTYSFVSLYRLQKRRQRVVHYKDNIFLSDNIDTAFVLGVFRPKIYLPSQLRPTEREYILLHEQMHIKYLDHVVKLVSFMALTIHWFNPLVWITFFVSGIDMEMTCDERVIKLLGDEVKADYATSLLTLATDRRIIGGTPLASGERETKGRIINVLHYKKPGFWVMIVGIIVVITLVVGLMVNPKDNGADLTDQETEIAEGDRTDAQMKTNDITIYSSEELWKARTKYIGNNSAVGKLIYLLPKPEEAQYDHTELQTSKEPYFVDIYYTIPKSQFESYQNKSAKSLDIFRKNALVMLALVDNAGGVRYCFTQEQRQTDLVITRIEADEILGKQVREYGESLATLQELINVEMNQNQVNLLEQAIHEAILNQNINPYREGDLTYESHVILGTQESNKEGYPNTKTLTIYAMVLYEEYSVAKDTGIRSTSGSHGPTALTFIVEGQDGYVLDEYWMPRDGSLYAKDIKSKFPKEIQRNAVDTQKYILGQIQSNYAQLIKEHNINTTSIIEDLFDTIMSSPKGSSNPKDYIEVHRIDYRELTYYGDESLKYCFREFLEGGQTGLKGSLMESLCHRLLGKEDISFSNCTGQAWFDDYLAAIKTYQKKEGMDYIKAKMPKAYLLLDIPKK